MNGNVKLNKTELFESKPVFIAILSFVVPAVISQLVLVLYGVADTYFIAMTGDPQQVAASNIILPFFIFLTGISNLFGIGGASLISRYLGKSMSDSAKKVSAFCIWSTIFVTLVFGLGIFFGSNQILTMLGANELTLEFCKQYSFWTITLGGVPTVLNIILSHIVRADGYSKHASFGIILGTVLNIILDPIFIIGLRLNIRGSGIATMISNSVAMLYFIILVTVKKRNTVISFNPKLFSIKDRIPSEVILVGLPSAVLSLMSTISNATLNVLLSTYSNEAIAGVGIAKKIDMITFYIATGIAQGIVPLIGYNYAKKNFERMKKTISYSCLLSFSVAVVFTVVLYTLAQPIVKFFINDGLTVEYAQHFQKIICISGPYISITLMIISIFQSMGKKIQPLFLSLLRKGVLDIPLMFLLNSLIGIKGIIWATPAADFIAMLISILFFIPFWVKIRRTI